MAHLKGRILFMGLDGAGKTTLIRELQRQLTCHSYNHEENPRRSSTPTTKMSVPPGLKEGDPSLRTNLRDFIEREPTSKDINPHVPVVPSQSPTYQLDPNRFVQLVDLPGRRTQRSKWTTILTASEQVKTSSNPNLIVNPPIIGIVFVIDASDITCFPLVAKELVHVYKLRDQVPHLRNVPVILILNKIDHWGETTSSDKRKASRMVRQELKKCLEYQLLVDMKRYPRAYTHFNLKIKLINASMIQQQKLYQQEAMSNYTLAMMSSIMESCALDSDHIRMLHLWLKEEVSKVWK